MVARFPHPSALPITIPSTSPMEHPVRQCKVALKAVRLSGLFQIAICVLRRSWFLRGRPVEGNVEGLFGHSPRLLNPQEPFHGGRELFDPLVRALSLLDGFADAVLDVVLQQDGRHLLRGRDDAPDLGEDVHTVGLFVHHTLEPAHLTFDPPQTFAELLLVPHFDVSVRGRCRCGVLRLLHSYTSGSNLARRSRRAFDTTVTDESAMAAAAKTGLRRPASPKTGYRTPAATGM